MLSWPEELGCLPQCRQSEKLHTRLYQRRELSICTVNCQEPGDEMLMAAGAGGAYIDNAIDSGEQIQLGNDCATWERTMPKPFASDRQTMQNHVCAIPAARRPPAPHCLTAFPAVIPSIRACVCRCDGSTSCVPEHMLLERACIPYSGTQAA